MCIGRRTLALSTLHQIGKIRKEDAQPEGQTSTIREIVSSSRRFRMVRLCLLGGYVVLPLFALTGSVKAADPTAADRGRKALLERAFNSVTWSFAAYDNAWRQWPDKPQPKPSSYAQAFQEHY